MKNRILVTLIALAIILIAAHLLIAPRTTTTASINTVAGNLVSAPDTLPARPIIPHLWYDGGPDEVYISVYPSSDPRGEKIRWQMEEILKSRGFWEACRARAPRQWGVKIIPLDGGVSRALIQREGRDCDWKEFVLPDSSLTPIVLDHVLRR